VVKKVVDKTIKELNRLLSGKLTDEWLHQDQMKLIWPPGATLGPSPGEAPKAE
jgi:hypothetical protein